jgi:hypothetical protein
MLTRSDLVLALIQPFPFCLHSCPLLPESLNRLLVTIDRSLRQLDPPRDHLKTKNNHTEDNPPLDSHAHGQQSWNHSLVLKILKELLYLGQDLSYLQYTSRNLRPSPYILVAHLRAQALPVDLASLHLQNPVRLRDRITPPRLQLLDPQAQVQGRPPGSRTVIVMAMAMDMGRAGHPARIRLNHA